MVRHVVRLEQAKPLATLLFGYRGTIGRREFLFAELVRGGGLGACFLLYQHGWIVIAAILAPVAIWPGIVATIKRFRDLGHDPLLILPVLMYLSGGFAIGYKFKAPEIGLFLLTIYLIYVCGFKGLP